MRTRIWLVGAAVGIVSACAPSPPPGELVGRYRITGTMASDSCGPGLGANRSIAFNVELRDDDGVAYWLFGDRRPTPGTLDEQGRFAFEQQGGWTLVNPDPTIGYAGCNVAQIEIIGGRVTLETPDGGIGDVFGDLTGTNTIDVTPMAGYDCTPALASQGGPLAALPCRVAYTLAGKRIDDEP